MNGFRPSLLPTLFISVARSLLYNFLFPANNVDALLRGREALAGEGEYWSIGLTINRYVADARWFTAFIFQNCSIVMQIERGPTFCFHCCTLSLPLLPICSVAMS